MEKVRLEAAMPCKFCGAGERYKDVRMIDLGNARHKAMCMNCHAETIAGDYDHAFYLWQSGEYTIPTHDEKQILKGCLSLMHGLYGDFLEYLDFMGVEPMGEDEEPTFRYTPLEVVRRLFLWNTSHSGGTSTAAKCRELGIDDAWHDFVFERDEGDEDE